MGSAYLGDKYTPFGKYEKMTTRSQNSGVGYSYGLAAALRIISGKWKPLILNFMLDGPKRYGVLKRTIKGVSDKVLIQQLKELEAGPRAGANRLQRSAPARGLRADPARPQPGPRDPPAL